MAMDRQLLTGWIIPRQELINLQLLLASVRQEVDLTLACFDMKEDNTWQFTQENTTIPMNSSSVPPPKDETVTEKPAAPAVKEVTEMKAQLTDTYGEYVSQLAPTVLEDILGKSTNTDFKKDGSRGSSHNKSMLGKSTSTASGSSKGTSSRKVMASSFKVEPAQEEEPTEISIPVPTLPLIQNPPVPPPQLLNVQRDIVVNIDDSKTNLVDDSPITAVPEPPKSNIPPFIPAWYVANGLMKESIENSSLLRLVRFSLLLGAVHASIPFLGNLAAMHFAKTSNPNLIVLLDVEWRGILLSVVVIYIGFTLMVRNFAFLIAGVIDFQRYLA
jgi:hypothetical protein